VQNNLDAKILKYPLVLVHGIAANDNRLFWGRIPERLRNAGIDVFLGNTDSWAGVESNALLLKDTIDELLERFNVEKVNILAHSKGGIDSRYLISTLGYGYKIASLTTISTTHLGSELVDFIVDKKYIHTKLAKGLTDSLVKLFGDKSPDPYKVLKDLTTDNMKIFNDKNRNNESVYYDSYYSIMKNRFDDLSHVFSYNLIRKQAGPNDGIVSMSSSKWGNNHTLIDGITGGISHSEVIDIKRRKISGVNIPGEYLKIVDKLINMGF